MEVRLVLIRGGLHSLLKKEWKLYCQCTYLVMHGEVVRINGLMLGVTEPHKHLVFAGPQ